MKRKPLTEIANFGFGPASKKGHFPGLVRPSVNSAGDPYTKPDIGWVIDRLKQRTMGLKTSTEEFYGELHVGQGEGRLQILFCPYGGLKAVIRRKHRDLHGESVWVCKRVVVMDDQKYDGHWERLVNDVTDQLTTIFGEMLDTPANDWDRMERLAVRIANRVRSLRPDIFVFEGVRKKSDDYYIIHFGLRGQGVEGPGAQRVEQFQVSLYYDRDAGYIRSWGNDVTSPTRRHKWDLAPAEWNEIHFPSQSDDEIVDCHVGQLLTY